MVDKMGMNDGCDGDDGCGRLRWILGGCPAATCVFVRCSYKNIILYLRFLIPYWYKIVGTYIIIHTGILIPSSWHAADGPDGPIKKLTYFSDDSYE